MAKKETFNQLDEKFQVLDHHDPEIIFPEEYEMIKDMRAQRPELEKESDKFLVVFLCARRHNVPETIKLLDKFIKKRKELGFDVHPPSIKDEDLKRHFETGIILQHKGAVDKHNRILNYVYVAKDKPKERPINVLDRVEVGDAEGLKNYIHDEWLLTCYGGKWDYTIPDVVATFQKYEEDLAKSSSSSRPPNNYSGKWDMDSKKLVEVFKKHEEGTESTKKQQQHAKYLQQQQQLANNTPSSPKP